MDSNPWGAPITSTTTTISTTIATTTTTPLDDETQIQFAGNTFQNLMSENSLDSLMVSPQQPQMFNAQDPWGRADLGGSEAGDQDLQVGRTALGHEDLGFAASEGQERTAEGSEVAPFNSPVLAKARLEYQTIDKIKIEVSHATKTLFTHQSYFVHSTSHGRTVTRRYSDFLWLQDLLLKRYPFRIVTNLPPKKAVGADTAFIEKRRRGLQRFLNVVANHRVLSVDDVVVQFLTNPKSIYELKSQSTIIYLEEYERCQIDHTSLYDVGTDFDDLLTKYHKTLIVQIDHISALLNLFTSMVARLHAQSLDWAQVGILLLKSSRNIDCPLPRCGPCILTELHCNAATHGLASASSALIDQGEAVASVLLEGLRTYRDVMVGFAQLLGRREMVLPSLSVVPTLRRISVNKNRMVEMTTKGLGGKEIARVALSIEEDENEAEGQRIKALFLRHCMWTEFEMLHAHRKLFSDFLQGVMENQVLYASEHLSIFSLLAAKLNETDDDEEAL